MECLPSAAGLAKNLKVAKDLYVPLKIIIIASCNMHVRVVLLEC